MVVNLPYLWGSYPNFLRPTCPYTECQPYLQTGAYPTENTTAGYGSYLLLNYSRTDILLAAPINPWMPCRHYLVLPDVMDFANPAPSFTGLFSRTLSSRRSFSVVRQNSGKYGLLLIVPISCHLFCRRKPMPDIFQHLYRIVLLTCC